MTPALAARLAGEVVEAVRNAIIAELSESGNKTHQQHATSYANFVDPPANEVMRAANSIRQLARVPYGRDKRAAFDRIRQEMSSAATAQETLGWIIECEAMLNLLHEAATRRLLENGVREEIALLSSVTWGRMLMIVDLRESDPEAVINLFHTINSHLKRFPG